MVTEFVKITGTLSDLEGVSGTLSPIEEVSGVVTIPTIVRPESYTGPYHVTPAAESQVLETTDMIMDEDVVIDPIPSNYGLITWNGSTLTVS